MLTTGIISISAESGKLVNEGTIDLNNIDLFQLTPGEEITTEELTIKQYTYEEEAEKIAEMNGKDKEEVFSNLTSNVIEGDNKVNSCATGATAFRRNLDVTNSYQLRIHIWTELCQNSAGQYVVDNIVDITIDRSYNGVVRGFDGTTNAQALNCGKSLYYSAEGSFYNNSETTVESYSWFNHTHRKCDIQASSTSSYYGYVHQTDNIILFD